MYPFPAMQHSNLFIYFFDFIFKFGSYSQPVRIILYGEQETLFLCFALCTCMCFLGAGLQLNSSAVDTDNKFNGLV